MEQAGDGSAQGPRDVDAHMLDNLSSISEDDIAAHDPVAAVDDDDAGMSTGTGEDLGDAGSDEEERLDDDEDDDDRPRPPPPRRINVPMDLLRMIGLDMAHRSSSHESLVDSLRSSGHIRSNDVEAIFRALPRAWFLPPAAREEALIDAPVRLDEYGFNVSAPHMHAAMIEELAIEAGQDVLDVGCGCGITTAYCALRAGSEGSVCAIDIRQSAARMTRSNIDRAMRRKPHLSFAPVEVYHGDVFLPGDLHDRKFDKIHIGGTCPSVRMDDVLALVKPGGTVVVPLESHLVRVSVSDSGEPAYHNITAVRFSDLECPRESVLALARLSITTRDQCRVQVPPWTPPAPPDAGDVDIALAGSSFEVPVPRRLLAARSSFLQAMVGSGMRDANAPRLALPEHVPEAAVRAFVAEIAREEGAAPGAASLLEAPIPDDAAAAAADRECTLGVLEVAHYLGVDRVAALAVARLLRALWALGGGMPGEGSQVVQVGHKIVSSDEDAGGASDDGAGSAPDEDAERKGFRGGFDGRGGVRGGGVPTGAREEAIGFAAQLLVAATDLALPELEAATSEWALQNFDALQLAASEAWRALPQPAALSFAARAAAAYKRVMGALEGMARTYGYRH